MRRVLPCLALALGIPVLMAAQSRTGVQGIVTDATKNELPGVTITLRNEQSRAVSTTVTNAAGRYQLQVPAGVYEITADLKGFEMQRLTSFQVREGTTPSQDFVMMIASRN